MKPAMDAQSLINALHGFLGAEFFRWKFVVKSVRAPGKNVRPACQAECANIVLLIVHNNVVHGVTSACLVSSIVP